MKRTITTAMQAIACAIVIVALGACGGGDDESAYDCSWQDQVITVPPVPASGVPPGAPVNDSPASPCQTEGRQP